MLLEVNPVLLAASVVLSICWDRRESGVVRVQLRAVYELRIDAFSDSPS